jgi:hypothetical protein
MENSGPKRLINLVKATMINIKPQIKIQAMLYKPLPIKCTVAGRCFSMSAV